MNVFFLNLNPYFMGHPPPMPDLQRVGRFLRYIVVQYTSRTDGGVSSELEAGFSVAA